MAGAAEKKKAERNTRLLRQLLLAIMGVGGWHWGLGYVVFPLVIGWGSFPHWLFAVLSVLATGISVGCYFFLAWFARPSSDGSFRQNVTDGLGTYAWDAVILSLATLVLTPLHRYFWSLLLLLPVYAAWKAFSLYFQMAHSQRDAAIVEEEEEKEGKRLARKQRKAQGKKKTVAVRR